MPGSFDRLAAMKAKQEVGDTRKATEKVSAEKATNIGELGEKRAAVMAEYSKAETTAQEALSALQQAESFASEQGENLDPSAKEEIEAIKAEAKEAIQKSETLKAELAEVNAEIHALEGGEKLAAEKPVETQVGSEALAEQPEELPKSQEKSVEQLSPAEINDKLKNEAIGPVKDIEDWYKKIMTGTGTLTDANFATKQVEKLKQIQGLVDSLGNEYVNKRTQEGAKTDAFKTNMEKFKAKVSDLQIKLEDRVMLASEQMAGSPDSDQEQALLKKIRPETLQEDLKIAVDKVALITTKMYQYSRNWDSMLVYGTGKKPSQGTLDKYQMLDELGQSVDDLSERLKFVEKAAKTHTKEERQTAGFKRLSDEYKSMKDFYEEKKMNFERLASIREKEKKMMEKG